MPKPLEISSNTMVVRFKSDNSLTSKGFSATYTKSSLPPVVVTTTTTAPTTQTLPPATTSGKHLLQKPEPPPPTHTHILLMLKDFNISKTRRKYYQVLVSLQDLVAQKSLMDVKEFFSHQVSQIHILPI